MKKVAKIEKIDASVEFPPEDIANMGKIADCFPENRAEALNLIHSHYYGLDSIKTDTGGIRSLQCLMERQSAAHERRVKSGVKNNLSALKLELTETHTRTGDGRKSRAHFDSDHDAGL